MNAHGFRGCEGPAGNPTAVGLIRKLEGVHCGGEGRLDVMNDKPLKALHGNASECNWVAVIVAGGRR